MKERQPEPAYTYLNGQRIGLEAYYQKRGIPYYHCALCLEVHPESGAKHSPWGKLCPACWTKKQPKPHPLSWRRTFYQTYELEVPTRT